MLITESTRETAIFTLKALGMKKNKGVILDSEQLAKMSDSELKKRFSQIKAVVMASQADKIRMLRAAHENGAKVLVTGMSLNDVQAFGEADAAMASVGCTSAVRRRADISADCCGIRAAAELFSCSSGFMVRCRALLTARIVCTVILGIISIFSFIGW